MTARCSCGASIAAWEKVCEQCAPPAVCRCGAPVAVAGLLCGPCREGERFEAEKAAWLARRAPADRARATAWARELLADPEQLVLLDTETTGIPRTGARRRRDEPRAWLAGGQILGHHYQAPAYVVDLGLITGTGAVLLDTLVNPGVPIDPGATAVHGITQAAVADAPGFAELLPALEQALVGKRCVIFNAQFDVAVLNCELTRLYGLDVVTCLPEWWASLAVQVECAMFAASDHRGEWNDYRHDWGWPKLANTAPDAHRAISDCRATLACMEAMAADTTTPPWGPT